MAQSKFTDYFRMAATKLDTLLNNLQTLMSNVDIRREPQWDLSTLEHTKTRLQRIAADALEGMNLIDELKQQLSQD
jgi:hypothetical protein